MTSVPQNLTLIREDFRSPRTLSVLKAAMEEALTDYVMVVGKNDIVYVTGDLTSDIHYLQTHVATRRAYRYSRTLLAFDPIHLIQANYMGMVVLHKSLVPLFPDVSVEPWHRLVVRAQLQGASFGIVAGSHTIIESWPRPELTGAYGHFQYSMDPEAVMEAVPSVVVEEINQQPVYRLRDPRNETVTAFCRGCSADFMAELAAQHVAIETMSSFDYSRIRAAQSTYVAWFDSIEGAVSNDTLNQLQLALEFPGVVVASPRVVTEITIPVFYHPAFSMLRYIVEGHAADAWMAPTRGLGAIMPTTGYVNTQAILVKIP